MAHWWSPRSSTNNPNSGVESNIATIIGVSVFTIVLAVTSMLGRFLARRMNRLKWEADDWFIVVATTFVTADAACYLACIQYGFGRHISTLKPEQDIKFFQIAYATYLLYGLAATAVKISVLLFYRRMFPTQTFKRWLILLGVLSIIWFLLITLISIFQCMPVQKAWDSSVEGKCIPYLNIFIGIQAANILLDTVVLCLPISAVMSLHMAKSARLTVAGIFGLGGLSIIFALVRLVVLVQDRTQTDITYATSTASWSVVEPAFQIFCACLPTLGPLIRKNEWFKRLVSSITSSFHKESYGRSSDKSYTDSSFMGDPSVHSHGVMALQPVEVTENARQSVSTDKLPLHEPRYVPS